jgi:hypothetical protein
MSTALDQALAQAQAAAANVVPAAVVMGAVPGTAVGNYAAAQSAVRLTNEDFMNSSLGTKGYVKITEDGMKFGKDGTLISDAIDVIINLADIVNTQAIKTNTTPARYEKTFDGIMAASGKPWQLAISEIQQLTPAARPYPSADIPFTIVGDVLNSKKAVQAADGERWGYSLSTTNRDAWGNFLREVAAAGLDVNSGSVRAQIGAEAKSGNGNTWGIMTFKYLGVQAN